MKLRARADEPKTTLALLDRFKSELVVIEPPRSVEVLGGKLGHSMRVAQWSGHGDIISWSAGWMNMLTAAGAKSHRVTSYLTSAVGAERLLEIALLPVDAFASEMPGGPATGAGRERHKRAAR